MCQRVGTGVCGKSATLDKALTTEILQCLVKDGVVLISKLSSPSNTSSWGSRKARPGGYVSCQLVEPRAPLSGGWLLGGHGREVGSRGP